MTKGFEYSSEGKMIAMICQDCGERLEPMNKKHNYEDCKKFALSNKREVNQ